MAPLGMTAFDASAIGGVVVSVPIGPSDLLARPPIVSRCSVGSTSGWSDKRTRSAD